MAGPTSGRSKRSQPPVQLKLERTDAMTLLFGGLVGLLLGLLIGWVIWPVEWTGVLPADLAEEERQVYLQMVADSYVLTNDRNEALRSLQSWSPSAVVADLEALLAAHDAAGRFDAASRVDALLTDLNLRALAADEPATGIGLGDILVTILYSLLAAVLIIIGLVGFRYVYMQAKQRERRPAPAGQSASPVVQQPAQYPQEQPTGSGGHRPFKPPPTSAPAAGSAAVAEAPAPAIQTSTATAPAETASAAATQTYTARYNLGAGEYEELFSIEFKPGEYAGDCGMAVLETLGQDDMKATALEVWLFDKSHIRTVTTVLMSEYAYEDPNLKSQLQRKGDLILARPDEQFTLKAEALEVAVHVREVEYAESEDLPPQSVFQSVEVEFIVSPRGDRRR